MAVQISSSAFLKPSSRLIPPPLQINSVLQKSSVFADLRERVLANAIDLNAFCRTVPRLFVKEKDLPATFLILATDAVGRNAIGDALTFMAQMDPLPDSKTKDLHYEHFLVNLIRTGDSENVRKAVARAMTKISDPDIQKRTFLTLFECAKRCGKIDEVVEIVEKTRTVPRLLKVGNEALKVLYEVLVDGFSIALKNKEQGAERIVLIMNQAVPNPKTRNILFQRMFELFNEETGNVTALLFAIRGVSEDESLQNKLLRAISLKAAISDDMDAFLNVVQGAISDVNEKNQILAQFSVNIGFYQNFSKALVVREHISDTELKNDIVHWFCDSLVISGDIKTALETLSTYVSNPKQRDRILESLALKGAKSDLKEERKMGAVLEVLGKMSTEAQKAHAYRKVFTILGKRHLKASCSAAAETSDEHLKGIAFGVISSVLKNSEEVAKFVECTETFVDKRAQIKALRQACIGLLKNEEFDSAVGLAAIVFEKLAALPSIYPE